MLADKPDSEIRLNASCQPQSRSIKSAIVAILAACFALSLGDAFIKQSNTNFTLWQIFVMRSAIAIPFLVYFVRIRTCETPIKPKQMFWTILRSLILVLMWVFYYLALPHVPLSTATATYYILPIFIILVAALFVGDKIGLKGWIAVALGFTGVLLVLKPEPESFNVYTLLPLISAFCYALAMIMTRLKCAHEKPLVLSLWLNISFVAVGALASLIIYLWNPTPANIESNPFVLGAWASMWLDEWRIMAILAVAMAIGSVCAALAYQTEYSSTIATFDFTYILFATLWGFVFFAELPDLISGIGIVLIIGGGILSIRRQEHSLE